MTPGDVAGVFSRYFMVGFFLPAFFVLVGLSVSLTSDFVPNAYETFEDGARILILGGAGLLVGLLLLGLNWQVFRLFEGYPLVARKDGRVLGHLHNAFVHRQRRRYETLVEIRDDTNAENRKRAGAAWRLDRDFPPVANQILPTRFGNAVMAFETASMSRWGLDSIPVWPRVDMLLSEREAELQANGRSEAAFFVNGSLLLTLAGGILIADQAINEPLKGFALAAYAGPFLLALLLGRWASGAATRWGNVVRSAIDLHRFELYAKLGVRKPTGFTDERENIGPVVSELLLYGHLPDHGYFAPPGDDKERP